MSMCQRTYYFNQKSAEFFLFWFNPVQSLYTVDVPCCSCSFIYCISNFSGWLTFQWNLLPFRLNDETNCRRSNLEITIPWCWKLFRTVPQSHFCFRKMKMKNFLCSPMNPDATCVQLFTCLLTSLFVQWLENSVELFQAEGHLKRERTDREIARNELGLGWVGKFAHFFAFPLQRFWCWR